MLREVILRSFFPQKDNLDLLLTLLFKHLFNYICVAIVLTRLVVLKILQKWNLRQSEQHEF